MNKIIINVIISMIIIQSVILFQNDFKHTVADSILPKYYVDDDFNLTTPGWQTDHFDSIQDAINAAENGDRIIVYEGSYFENILINKSISLFGEDVDEVIIDGGNSGTIVTINISNVDFSTFTLQNGGTNSIHAGIKLTSNSGYCHIVENKIISCMNGLFLDNCHNNILSQNQIIETINATFLLSSNDNTIEYNTLYDNSQHGIFLNRTCENNIIQNNLIYQNEWNGIYLNDECSNNIISNNTIYGNENTGIRLEDDVSTTTISNNIVYENTNYGIFIVGSNTQVNNNLIFSNEKHGIFLFADDNTTVESNNVSLNEKEGIRLQNSSDDTITSNVIYQNQRYGMYINYYSTNNIIYNNIFKENVENARDISKQLSGNIWNITNITGSNIINGPFFGGNFWDDYTGVDSNRTGLGNQPYLIPGGNKKDMLPLVYLRPIAHAGGSYRGSVFENIAFDASLSYNLDETINITDYTWTFSDGTTASGIRPKHNFSEPGNFSVTVTVINEIGGIDSDTTYVIITPDLTAPTINVVNHDLVVTDSSTLYTIRVKVIENVKIHNVTMKYWFDNASDQIQTNLNKINDTYYEKTIFHSESVENVFCIITAIDVSNNINTTENPVAVFTCKQLVNVSESISFDGTESFDLDGSITSFSWNFGDGVVAKGSSVNHVFTADGTYTISLMVVDNIGNVGVSKKQITVATPEPIKASNTTLDLINNKEGMNLFLSEPFLSYDTNNDGTMDMFVDPNGELSSTFNPLKIDNELAFLLSYSNEIIPLLFWKPESDSIEWITYVNPSISSNDVIVDYDNNRATLSVTVDKNGWIIIDVVDSLYPDADIKEVRKENNNNVPTNQIWRENGHIYILDDPSRTYDIIFKNILPSLEATFTPSNSGVIDSDNPSVLIQYNIAVEIDYAYFNGVKVTDDLIMIDEQTYQYTPPGYLENGTYVLEIQAQALYGNDIDVSSATYFYFQYKEPPQPSFIQQYGLPLLIIGIILCGVLFYGVSRYLGYSFDSYIYIKNKAIIPFIKPVVFGPISVSVDSDNVSKAEFYVDGELKHTVSKAPFSWQWSESAFLKHRVEAKVFDTSGKTMSSGEMSVFIINPFSYDSIKLKNTEKIE